MREITWEEFEAVELRVGTVVAAEDFPEAREPAYKITADFGPEIGVRRSSARITHLYSKEALVGRHELKGSGTLAAAAHQPPTRMGLAPVRPLARQITKRCLTPLIHEPAFRAGALDDSHVDFFRRRLANRLGHLLTTMRNNGLDTLNGAADLARILHSVEMAPTLAALAELAEPLHAAGHVLLDALE